MTRQHNSFLVRCWSRNGAYERVQIEHIQTGEQFVASSVSDVVAWICARDEGMPPGASSDSVLKRRSHPGRDLDDREHSKGGEYM